MSETVELKRSVSLLQLTLYGLGTTVGAGIYALTGVVAGRAGLYAPVSFALAAALAGVTALSFAEMAARFPKSAGEAVYVREGLGSNRLALAVGLLVVGVGIISSAALLNGFVGYLQDFITVPREVSLAVLAVVLFLIAGWGIGPSVTVAGVITVIEVGGLILVIWAGSDGLADALPRWRDFVPGLGVGVWGGIFAGAIVAFYAFLGFEDMVNVAEEVRDAPRVLPLGIVLTLGVTLVLYVAVSLSAVAALDPSALAASEAPLRLLFEHGSSLPPQLIGLISLLAIINGALVQVIMASRVLYGLVRQGALPGRLFAPLGRVHPWTRTPVVATALAAALVLVLALGFRIAPLAETTSVITLVIFMTVNLALVRLKMKTPAPAGLFTLPFWLPVLGAGVSALVLMLEAVRLVA